MLLRLFVVSGSYDVPTEYIFRYAKQREGSYSRDTAKEYVEELVLQANKSRLEDCLNEDSEKQKKRLTKARRIFAQYGLQTWAVDLNTRLGIAPSTDAFLRRNDANIKEDNHNGFRKEYHDPETSTSRMFAHRWRKFWGGSIGYMRVREELLVETIRQKAQKRHAVNNQKPTFFVV